jgi:hypothetical protein
MARTSVRVTRGTRISGGPVFWIVIGPGIVAAVQAVIGKRKPAAAVSDSEPQDAVPAYRPRGGMEARPRR